MFSGRLRLTGITIMLGLFAFGVASTAIIQANGWDLEWSGLFYTQGGIYGGWTQSRDRPWDLFYDYGTIPTWIILLLAIGLYVAVLARRAPMKYAKPCLVIVLTVALGPGLLVNGLLKPYWGRPRPADVASLGGDQQYRNVWPPVISGTSRKGNSFTCGHCAMAFAVTSVAAFYPFHPMLSVVALSGGIVYGTAVSAGRLVQGGHFTTDAIWSAVLILMLVTALYFLVLRIPENTRPFDP